MNNKRMANVFPKHISVNDVLKIIEQKVREHSCSLEEAYKLLVEEKLRENN